MLRRTVVLGLAAAAVPRAAAAQSETDAPALPPRLGVLSTHAVTMPPGEDSTLAVHLGPGPAVISFWATWCPPCVSEGRRLAEWRTRVAPGQLNIIGVNMDRDRSAANLAPFMRRARMNYTQLWGTLGLYRAFGNPGEGTQILLPRLYVFAADGAPIAAFGRYNGADTLRAVDRAIERALG